MYLRIINKTTGEIHSPESNFWRIVSTDNIAKFYSHIYGKVPLTEGRIIKTEILFDEVFYNKKQSDVLEVSIEEK